MRSRAPRTRSISKNFVIDGCSAWQPAPRHHGECPRPRKGTLPGSAWSYKAGGKGGNQAVAAAQFGAQAFMIGRVGDDDFGKRLLSHLQVLRLTRSTSEPTRREFRNERGHH